jgi:3-deoxy-manno-octulosonate cytidylyltransferase (CMP-KDO synthetase)
MKIVAVIPARYQSSRLPGKPLAEIAGEPMIRWVYERARKAQFIDEVWVATDDERIYKVVKNFGGNAQMTSSEHQSGTDRIAEIVRHVDWDLVINVQGDEPLIDPDMIDEVILCFKNNPSVYMGTLKREIKTTNEVLNPNVVKVVTDNKGYALYFSRSPLPFLRTLWNTIQEIEHAPLSFPIFKHIGLYGYTRDFLLHFASLKPTPLEKIEHLEQLRALEHGYKIKVGITEKDSLGVDHLDDLQQVRTLVKQQGLSINLP